MATWGALLQFLIILSFPLFSKSVYLEESNELKTDAGDLNLRCIYIERNALLKFKEGLMDPLGQLASWVGKDCCRWKGVHCSNGTGHVVKLNLRDKGDCFMKRRQYAAAYYNNSSCLGGKISPSLLDLKYLKYLDLSMNDFQGIPIPDFFGSFERMRYLNLSYANFSGMVPPHLGNLSNLRSLDLYSIGSSWVSDLNWVSGLTSLKYLDLGYINLTLETNWLQALNTLPSLSELHLFFCGLQNIPPSPLNLNFTSLSVLDLSYNYFNSLPQWLFNISSLAELRLRSCSAEASISQAAWEDLCHLQVLDLSDNEITGDISDLIGALSRCSNHSIEMLELGVNKFSGQLPESLGFLKNLRYLRLYENFITGPIPESIGKLSKLNFLGLAWNQLNGTIPESIGKLSKLNYLGLAGNEITGDISDIIGALSRCSNHSIEMLDLRANKFSGQLPESLGFLKNLRSLDLYENFITGPIPESIGKLSKLNYLGLAGNEITGDISDIIGALSRCSNHSIEMLELAANKFSGQLPESLGFLKNLRSLYLDQNFITGPIPESIGKLSKLNFLGLAWNQLNGTIPESVGKLTELTDLRLYENSWGGVLSQKHFEGLKKLEYFLISSSNKAFSINLSDEWVPPFSLRVIEIDSCPVGPKFPAWLRTQKQLQYIFLTNVSISGTIPHWFWKLCPQIEELDLSYNQLGGMLPVSLAFTGDTGVRVDFSFNRLSGQIPLWPNVIYLILANNSFSGSIPTNIGQVMSQLKYLDLSGNFLNDSIPFSISDMKYLEWLDLSNNHLCGEIHVKWRNLLGIEFIDLSTNNLSGNIPSSICSMPYLYWLGLSSNSLSGELSSLKNCTSLKYLDLGDNKFSGNIPQWIGERLLSLVVLRIRANMFYGNIPEKLCHLYNLHILDLAGNNLSGSIPSCLGNLSGMSSWTNYTPYSHNSLQKQLFIFHMVLVVKGLTMTYTRTLDLVRIIDLSSNNLRGDIPEEITHLSTLGHLNLSWNQLTGKIPDSIGSLKQLEGLDLSHNNLSGPIPLSLASVTSLSKLNVSHNNLSGQIPSTNQFQTFNDPSAYEGNPELCGSPLPTPCLPVNKGKVENHDAKDDGSDEDEKLPFYSSMVLGFGMGFWVVFGSLVMKRSWRHAYFRFLDRVADCLYIFVRLNMARLQRMMSKE